MTTNNTTTVATTSVFWNGDIVYVVVGEELLKLSGTAGNVFVREARKLHPTPAYPVNSRGQESRELDWLPGCGGLHLSADKAEQVNMLLEYLDCANFA